MGSAIAGAAMGYIDVYKRQHQGQASKIHDKISESIQYSMELWISHLFPELTSKEVSLLSLILHLSLIHIYCTMASAFFAPIPINAF